MTRSGSCYNFHFAKLFKSWKKGKAPPSIVFHEYVSDRSICVVHNLDLYLKRSEKWRDNGQKNQLLLSFVNPHKEVVKSTISGWIKFVLSQVGIDTNIFKAHSTRSASTSKVGSKVHSTGGLSIQDILDRGNWSNSSTWQTFYNKTIIKTSKNYEEILLGN